MQPSPSELALCKTKLTWFFSTLEYYIVTLQGSSVALHAGLSLSLLTPAPTYCDLDHALAMIAEMTVQFKILQMPEILVHLEERLATLEQQNAQLQDSDQAAGQAE